VAQAVAHPPDRHAEIVFTHELKPSEPPDLHREIGRHIPSVKIGSSDPFIAALPQQPVQPQVQHVILDQQQPRPPTVEIESFQDLDLVTFDVDRHEIDGPRHFQLGQDIVERPDRHRHRPLRTQTGDHQPFVQ
jgi:hypothetical protein